MLAAAVARQGDRRCPRVGHLDHDLDRVHRPVLGFTRPRGDADRPRGGQSRRGFGDLEVRELDQELLARGVDGHDPDAQLLSSGNVYDSSTGSMQSTGTAFTPPYPYELGYATLVKDAVLQGAGVR